MSTNRTYYSRDAEERAARDKSVATLVFLVFGLGIGTVLALLFAPKPGEKVREDIAHGVEEGLNSGREAVGPALKRLEKEFADLRKKVDDRIGDLH
jgi:gas vesicle protein